MKGEMEGKWECEAKLQLLWSGRLSPGAELTAAD